MHIGQTANNDLRKTNEAIAPIQLASELGKMTLITGVTRRQAINQLARRHGLTPNAVYKALEDAKKSVV